MKRIPYSRQWIDRGDVREVAGVLTSDWLTQGPSVDRFERALCEYTGARYCVAVSSGTAALHLAVLAAGMRPGDQGITSPITFVASSNCILYAGGVPVFADIRPDNANIDPLEIGKKTSSKTKVVIPVHLAGYPCDMPAVRAAAGKKAVVIEDACHALGAAYKDGARWVKVGSCRHSEMTIFSFHPLKAITTGEGGAIMTNDRVVYARLRSLRTHGIYKTERITRRHGPWYYQMRELGFNYRITDFQCALGGSQMKRVDSFIRRRQAIARLYDREFAGLPGVELLESDPDKRHARHLYVLRIDFPRAGITRAGFFHALSSRGIAAQVHYIPVYRQPYYRRLGAGSPADFPHAESYYARAVSLPLYPAMTDAQAAAVARLVGKIIRQRHV